MNENIVNIVTHLNKQLSRKYIERDLNSISNGLFIKIAAKLSKAATMQLLQNELQQLNNLYIQVSANLKTDDKIPRNRVA